MLEVSAKPILLGLEEQFMVVLPSQLLPAGFEQLRRPCLVLSVGSVPEVVQVECSRLEVLQPVIAMVAVDHEHSAKFCISQFLGLVRFVDVSSHCIIAKRC